MSIKAKRVIRKEVVLFEIVSSDAEIFRFSQQVVVGDGFVVWLGLFVFFFFFFFFFWGGGCVWEGWGCWVFFVDLCVFCFVVFFSLKEHILSFYSSHFQAIWSSSFICCGQPVICTVSFEEAVNWWYQVPVVHLWAQLCASRDWKNQGKLQMCAYVLVILLTGRHLDLFHYIETSNLY